MKNKLVCIAVIVLLVLILVRSCTGCGAVAEEESPDAGRFTAEYCGEGCYIITDNQTGAEYLFCKIGYSGGLIKLED